MACRRGDFSQLCRDRSWKRTMAAACNKSLVGGSGDHVRDVAMIVAVKKVDCENDVYIFKRPDYTAEEWRWLFMTTGSDYYLLCRLHTAFLHWPLSSAATKKVQGPDTT